VTPLVVAGLRLTLMPSSELTPIVIRCVTVAVRVTGAGVLDGSVSGGEG